MMTLAAIQQRLAELEREADALARALKPYVPADVNDPMAEARDRTAWAASELYRAQRAVAQAVKREMGGE